MSDAAAAAAASAAFSGQKIASWLLVKEIPGSIPTEDGFFSATFLKAL